MAKIIVSGPHGSGKTENAGALMKFFKTEILIDDWDGITPLPENALALTNNMTPNSTLADEIINIERVNLPPRNYRLKRFYRHHHNGPTPPHRAIVVQICGITFKGNNLMFNLPIDQTAHVTLSPTSKGDITEPVENIVYTSDNEAVATVDDGGKITPIALGTANISIIADALIGEGSTMISETLGVTVVAAQAVALNATIALD